MSSSTEALHKIDSPRVLPRRRQRARTHMSMPFSDRATKPVSGAAVALVVLYAGNVCVKHELLALFDIGATGEDHVDGHPLAVRLPVNTPVVGLYVSERDTYSELALVQDVGDAA